MKKEILRFLAHFVLAGATIALIAGIVWVVVDTWIMPSIARQDVPVVVVPDLTSKPPAEARAILARLGLEAVEDPFHDASHTVPKDLISYQKPAAGDTVKVGQVVQFWISAGSGEARVPDLVGQELAGAVLALQNLGFDADTSDVAWSEDTSIAYGHVLGTEPPAGSEAALGSRIRLVLSSGASGAVAAEDSIDSVARPPQSGPGSAPSPAPAAPRPSGESGAKPQLF